MIEFIANNYGSILIGFILLVVVAAVAIKMVSDKKKGKNACSCGCDGCPSAEICHRDK